MRVLRTKLTSSARASTFTTDPVLHPNLPLSELMTSEVSGAQPLLVPKKKVLFQKNGLAMHLLFVENINDLRTGVYSCHIKTQGR